VKKLTKRQWQSVYNSVCKSYVNSYAMMVGDAMKGFKKFETSYGLRTYWDGDVFMHTFHLVKSRGIGYDLSCHDLEMLNRCREDEA